MSINTLAAKNQQVFTNDDVVDVLINMNKKNPLTTTQKTELIAIARPSAYGISIFGASRELLKNTILL